MEESKKKFVEKHSVEANYKAIIQRDHTATKRLHKSNLTNLYDFI